jgi:hypothetical protein
MQQLRASIARDLVQGQAEHSPTRELIKQYVPLNGIIHTPEANNSLPDGNPEPVENCLAPHATLAQNDITAWHGATVAVGRQNCVRQEIQAFMGTTAIDPCDINPAL